MNILMRVLGLLLSVYIWGTLLAALVVITAFSALWISLG